MDAVDPIRQAESLTETTKDPCLGLRCRVGACADLSPEVAASGDPAPFQRMVMKTIRLPLLLFVLPAVLVSFLSACDGQLLLTRDALAGGEAWRLWTGHWIHFSASHLVWNLAVLLASGIWLERVRPGLLLRHTVAAAPLIGLTVLAGEPGLQTYGGLSGLATGVVVLLGLHQLRSPGVPRGLWLGGLALVFLKSAGDLAAPTDWLAHFAAPGIRPSSTAHAAGAITAVLHFIIGRGRGWRRDAPIPQATPNSAS